MKQQLLNLSAMIMLTVMFGVSNASAQICDTLRNWEPSDELFQMSANPATNGFVWGTNLVNGGTEQVLSWGERYTAGSAVEVKRLTFIPWKVVDGGGSVTFNIQSDDSGLPGTVQVSETVSLAALTENSLYIMDFTNPATVNGNFWVTMDVSYTGNDSIALLGTNLAGGGPNTTYMHTAGWGWEAIEDWYSIGENDKVRWRVDVLTSNGPAPTANATFNAASVCLGASFSVDASGSTNANFYDWYLTDDPLTTILENNTGTTTTTLTPTQSGSHRVYLFADGSCQTDGVYYIVNVDPAITATVSSTDENCGDNNGEIQITNPVGGSGVYSYSIDGGATTSSVSTYSGLSAGTYDVEVTTPGNGCVYSEQVTIQDSPGETISVGNDETICAGQTATLTASGNGSIEWFEGGNSLGTGNSITVSPTAVGANTYDVILTDANGCTDAGQVIVTVNPQDNAAFNYPSNTLCTGSSNVTPTISGTQNGTFSVNNTDLVIDPSSGEIDVNGSVAGTYIVTYSTTGLCPSSQTATITITTSPDASFSYNDTEFCSNDGVISPSFAPGASAGSFSSTTGLVFANSSTGEINLNASDAGTYTVTNTIAASGSCPAVSETFVITVFESPIVTATADETEVCAGDEVTLTATTSAGSVTWDNGVTNGTPFTPATTTTYTVTANDNGCEETQQITITVNEIPTITVTADETEVCTGEEVTLTATASAGTISWDNGVNNGTPFTPTATTTYTVTANDNGCEATEQITITVNELPNVSIDNGDLLACVYHNPIELTGIPAGGTFSGTGVTNNSFDPDAAGEGTHTITYTYEDADGCENSATIQIEVDGCVGISTNELNNQVVLYPNPSTNYIDVALLGNHEMASVVVISLEGKVVNTPTKTVDNQTTRIDVSSLSVGTYLVQISTNNGTITKKIMVQ